MAIIRLQHIGLAVKDMKDTCARFERIFGLKARDFRSDQGRGKQLDARILLGNQCWLHVVQNWDPEARVYQFLEQHGEGLEHIALETDDIEADVQRLRDAGVPIFEDTIFDANDGYEAFVYPDAAIGFTVELIQPHEHSWGYPDAAIGKAPSDKMGLVRLQHVGIVVRNMHAACDRFQQLFGLPWQDFRDDQGSGMQYDARILFGNECWMHVVQNWKPGSRVLEFLETKGERLEHIALQTTTVAEDIEHLNAINVPIWNRAILNAQDGFEAFVYPDDGVDFTVEIIQPHPFSWGYEAV